MPFPFVYICDLLEDLSHLSNRVIPLLPRDLEYRTTETTLRWLKRHRSILDAASTDADCVILTLQPEKRTDRVYGLDALALEQIIARVLNLPKQHCQDLGSWRNDDAQGDLASCVERVMKNIATVNSRVAIGTKAFAATAEQVDEALLRIASQNESSSAEVRVLALEDNGSDAIDVLSSLYQRLAPRDAKWLTRLILKDYGTVKFPDSLLDTERAAQGRPWIIATGTRPETSKQLSSHTPFHSLSPVFSDTINSQCPIFGDTTINGYSPSPSDTPTRGA